MTEIESLIAQMKDTVSDMPDDRYYQERIRKAAQRQHVEDTIECDYERVFEQPLGEVIAYLREIEKKHPGVMLDFNHEVDEVQFYLTRPETDAEFASRLERELSHLQFRRAQRDRERGEEVLRLCREQKMINQRLKELSL